MPCPVSKRLYLRGLARDIDEEDLAKYLSCYGRVTERQQVDYAFVQFEFEKDAQVVLDTYRNQPLLGRNVLIEFAHPMRKDLPSTPRRIEKTSDALNVQPSRRSAYHRHPVVVLNLPPDIKWQELKDFGRRSGQLVAYCDLDKTQRGRGFIEYFTREDAHQAIKILDGKRLAGHRVYVLNHEDIQRPPRTSRYPRSRSRSPGRSSDRTYVEPQDMDVGTYRTGRPVSPVFYPYRGISVPSNGEKHDWPVGYGGRYNISPGHQASQDQRQHVYGPHADDLGPAADRSAQRYDYNQGNGNVGHNMVEGGSYGEGYLGGYADELFRSYGTRDIDPYQ